MLSDATIARFRAVQTAAMPDLCEIQRRTPGSRNAYGERTETWATVATVPCRMADAKTVRSEGLLASVIATSNAQYILTVPFGTTVLSSDRVVYGGYVFEVAAESIPTTWNSATQVPLRRFEMEGGA